MAPSRQKNSPRKRVAIIGSGSAGMGALWALNRTPHDVYMYEAADRLGGHANTVEFRKHKYKTLVDTGFVALNTATYRMLPASLHHTKLMIYSQLRSIPQSYRRTNRAN
jgi:predicted NAD/FAD-binding protein